MIEDFKHQASKDTKKIKNVILGVLGGLVFKICNLQSSIFNGFH